MAIKTVWRSGDLEVRREDNTDRIKRQMAKAGAIAATAGAEQVRAELFGIYERQGDGQWTKLKAATVKRKGISTIMFDSGELLNALEIRVRALGRDYTANVGWFDGPHPGTNGRLTMAQLAMVHDGMGVAGDYITPGGKSFGTMAADGRFIPHRPWISQLVYREAIIAKILDKMERIYLRYMGVSKGGADPMAISGSISSAMQEMF